jgi:hypothetical protein
MTASEQEHARVALRKLFSKSPEIRRLQRAAICTYAGCNTFTVHGLCKRHRGASDAPRPEKL